MQSTALKHPHSDERFLLEQVAQGNSRAFWYLWHSYRTYLYNRCLYWMGGSTEKATETLSIVMVRAWEKLPKQAEKIIDLKAWLTRLTDNTCIDINQKQKKTDRSIASMDKSETIPDASSESFLLDREIHLYICVTIDRLPDRLREPFALHYYYDKTVQEIAAELSLSEGNVRERLQQARNLFERKLQQHPARLDYLDSRERQEIPSKSLTLKTSIREIFLSFLNGQVPDFA